MLVLAPLHGQTGEKIPLIYIEYTKADIDVKIHNCKTFWHWTIWQVKFWWDKERLFSTGLLLPPI